MVQKKKYDFGLSVHKMLINIGKCSSEFPEPKGDSYYQRRSRKAANSYNLKAGL